MGTDGISYQNLIELWPSLSESLIRAGNNILKYGTLPQQMSEVIITLIPKKLKTPIIENFRPISVISCAVRLLSSVIEKQLNPVLAKVIEKTQTGFLKKDPLVIAYTFSIWFLQDIKLLKLQKQNQQGLLILTSEKLLIQYIMILYC